MEDIVAPSNQSDSTTAETIIIDETVSGTSTSVDDPNATMTGALRMPSPVLVLRLMEMGFTEEVSIRALQHCNYSLNAAATYLLTPTRELSDE